VVAGRPKAIDKRSGAVDPPPEQNWQECVVTREKILAALDKPRKLYSILMVVDPSGSQEALQIELLKMRDEGLVKFDIHKGRWSKA
jgi:hypothetical protein